MLGIISSLVLRVMLVALTSWAAPVVNYGVFPLGLVLMLVAYAALGQGLWHLTSTYFNRREYRFKLKSMDIHCLSTWDLVAFRESVIYELTLDGLPPVLEKHSKRQIIWYLKDLSKEIK